MNSIRIKLTAVALFLVFVFSCQTTVSFYETYYIKGEALQYYLKKATIHSSGMDCSVDFTVRIGKEDKTDAIINFSLTTDSRSTAEKAFFSFDGMDFPVSGIEVLYIKRAEKIQRYSGQLTYNDFYKLMGSENPTLTVFLGDEAIIFKSSKEFDSARESLFKEIME